MLPERARFLSYANVDPAGIEPRPPNDPSAAPVVAHAPTNRGAKGTRFVLAALERLREEGVAFELRLIEGVGNREARELLSTSDLVVDQLLAGWYGGVANEAMAQGRAVVAYIRPGDLERVPAEQRKQLPVISATPDTIEPVLREWLTSRRAELPEVGARGRAYAERWHDPRAVAASLKGDYERAAGVQPGLAAGGEAHLVPVPRLARMSPRWSAARHATSRSIRNRACAAPTACTTSPAPSRWSCAAPAARA